MSRTLWPLAALATVALICAGCSNGSGSAENGNAGTGTASSGAHKKLSARDKAVKFAKCMRDNGVSAFPDPDASGELTIDAVANGSSVDTNSAAFKKATSACRDLQPPGFTGRRRTVQQQSASLRFAQCIRENGVKDFPDPANGEPLVNTYKIPSSNKPGGMAVLNAAMHKCGTVLREVLGGQR
jgi:hypothetical protein